MLKTKYIIPILISLLIFGFALYYVLGNNKDNYGIHNSDLVENTENIENIEFIEDENENEIEIIENDSFEIIQP
jgi:hypothetical protein